MSEERPQKEARNVLKFPDATGDDFVLEIRAQVAVLFLGWLGDHESDLLNSDMAGTNLRKALLQLEEHGIQVGPLSKNMSELDTLLALNERRRQTIALVREYVTLAFSDAPDAREQLLAMYPRLVERFGDPEDEIRTA